MQISETLDDRTIILNDAGELQIDMPDGRTIELDVHTTAMLSMFFSRLDVDSLLELYLIAAESAA